MSYFLQSLTLFTTIGLASLSFGQAETNQLPEKGDAEQSVDSQTPADKAYGPLGRDFKNLYESLRNRGGVSEEDRPAVLAMRERAAEFAQRFPDDVRGPTLQLALSTWLKDEEAVEKLYADVLKLSPEKTDVRLGWAERLKNQNRYAEAIEILRSQPIDPAKNPRAQLTLSDCLFAEHQFQESLDALNAIPLETLDTEMIQVKFQADQARKPREEYIGFWAQEQSLRQQEQAADDLPRVKLVTARGTIELELFENQAPNTVANFIHLIEQGFYNGTTFHRVINSFMAQGGDPNTKEGAVGLVGNGNPGYFIADETGRDDHRKHFAGSLGMHNQESPNTGGCQFYITHTPTSARNDRYTVFGRVLEGLDVARAIKQTDVIESISVLRKRDHQYTPDTLPLPGAAPAATKPMAPIVENDVETQE